MINEAREGPKGLTQINIISFSGPFCQDKRKVRNGKNLYLYLFNIYLTHPPEKCQNYPGPDHAGPVTQKKRK